MLELFSYPKSTCSQKVKLCLHEKGLPFETRHVDLARQEHLTPEYLAINPNGVVPSLRHNGEVVNDSSVIMEYLDEVFPEVPLSGPSPLDRARLRAWLRFFEEVPTVAIRMPSFAQVLLKPLDGMPADARRAHTDSRTIRREFYRSMENGISEERQSEALGRLRMTLERMEKVFVEQDYLMGARFTIADACIIPTIDRMEDLGHASQWADLSGVSAWWARVKSRQSYSATYAAGTRLIGGKPAH